MSPIALDGPAVEPVSVAEMRDFLRLDDDAQDDLVAALIAAARVTLEAATRRAFIAQTWRLRLRAWPHDRVVTLPLAPVLAVDAVRIGAASLDPGLYRLDASGEPARLLVDLSAADAAAGQAIEIDLTLGYGVEAQAVPAPLRLALRRLVARWYENRGDALPAGPADLKGDIAALIAPYLRPRLV
jgi:uncharacterized phiE125 gp8 family phage protein